jgi:hypothetical protein
LYRRDNDQSPIFHIILDVEDENHNVVDQMAGFSGIATAATRGPSAERFAGRPL